MRIAYAAGALSVLTLAAPVERARAFCGFYVSGADQSLYSNATMVVLLREGQRTVLSMQNNYEGPPEDFAMVVPVPVVLQEENVKTLPREIFQHVDSLAAPRLVEYWEEDPCSPPIEYERNFAPLASAGPGGAPTEGSADLGVRIEAQFAVAEYDIVILSANDSSGLETWLRRENYNIPSGAANVLRPYVQAGTKFFVAKVDVQRVTFANGRALLSPLRVHYDSQDFSLPVRLGLLNSRGEQDLIVHILGRGQRYEVANYANVTIPTNLRVPDSVRQDFGAFYEATFKRAIANSPRAVVTEYSWDSSSCDPCPTPPLEPGEVMSLGADVLPNATPHGFVLTRLHYRYGPSTLGEDLVFRAAPSITGGTGIPDAQGNMQAGAHPSGMNMFQGRYVILHPWEGAVSCANPNRGSWGGPPNGVAPQPIAATNVRLMTGATPAVSNAVAEAAAGARPEGPKLHAPRAGGCASCAASGPSDLVAPLAAAGLAFGGLLARRRAHRRRDPRGASREA